MPYAEGIVDTLHVKKGETVLVHGASGGVGTLAVQFAGWKGARVFATASGDDGMAMVRRLGADEAVDGRRQDLVAAARRFTLEARGGFNVPTFDISDAVDGGSGPPSVLSHHPDDDPLDLHLVGIDEDRLARGADDNQEGTHPWL